MNDQELPFVSEDGVGDVISNAPDGLTPEPSAAEIDEEQEEDHNAADNDDALLDAGESPEFEHLRKRPTLG